MATLTLTPRQVEEVRGAIRYRRMEFYAECSDEWESDNQRVKTTGCAEAGRSDAILARVLEKLNGRSDGKA